MKKETWIITANSTQARIFKLDGLTLIEMDSLIHPECRMHEKDLITDKPGSAEGVGKGIYPMDQKKSPKKIEATVFAKEVAQHLELARANGKIDRLFIAASPTFLGLIRQEINPLTANLINSEVNKDITHLRADEIIGYFPIGL